VTFSEDSNDVYRLKIQRTRVISTCVTFAAIWSGRFNVLASDPDRYSIVILCSEKLKKSKYVSLE
jgi:hypothetical protein